MTWVTKICFDVDGTQDLTIRSSRVSTQLLTEGPCKVVAKSDDGVVVEVFQASKTHYIHRKWEEEQ